MSARMDGRWQLKGSNKRFDADLADHKGCVAGEFPSAAPATKALVRHDLPHQTEKAAIETAGNRRPLYGEIR